MMERLEVNIQFDERHHERVGILTQVEGKVYFKYSKTFLQKKMNLSPFKLKFDDRIQMCPENPFDKLFGLFSDSLPDGWGKLVVDRYLISINKTPDDLTPLSRLSIVGQRGLGALTYQPTEHIENDENLSRGLSAYAEKSLQIIAGKNTEITDEFYSLTGTSGGARPKIQVIHDESSGTLRSGSKCKNKNESFWIVKFPSTHDFTDVSQIEYAYYLMAKDAGIKISESRLFGGDKNKKFFGTKRFDRKGNSRIHVHSLAGLLHDDFRKSTMDYGHIMDAVIRLEKNKQSLEKVMRLAMFNVLTANQDDHSKNFSFLMDKEGKWNFSPAYDLTFSPNLYGFQTMSVASNNKNISLADFQQLGNHFNFSTTSKIWKEVRAVIAEWDSYAKKAGVSEASRKRIKDYLF
ncbi:MAG: type II toxin-antitoxin system HipA family toxin [Bacteroidota bacterium]